MIVKAIIEGTIFMIILISLFVLIEKVIIRCFKPFEINILFSQIMAKLERILQYLLGSILIVVGIVNCRFNQIGQNLINMLAGCILIYGLDQIIIFYRCYLDEPSHEVEATFLILSLFLLGLIFENFNLSPQNDTFFNQLCFFIIAMILSVNSLYFGFMSLILLGYLIRFLYRLMTGTLINHEGIIGSQQLEIFMRRAKLFQEILKDSPAVNKQCSICLVDFQKDHNCMMIPECQHCFHKQCIESWLNSKNTCPYCRMSIHVGLL